MKSLLISIRLNINQGLLKSIMEANNTHDTKCESTPEAPPNIKFLMEPTSILANIKTKLGCRLGELGTPDSIHRTGQTLWLHQLGSTEPSFLLEAQGSPCLPLSLARSSQCESGNCALLLVTFSTPGCRMVNLVFLPPGNPWLHTAIDELKRIIIFHSTTLFSPCRPA